MFTLTDTKARSETGDWVHIKDNGVPAYLWDENGQPDTNKPIRIKVLGPHSPTLQRRAAKRNAQRAKELGGNVDFSKMATGKIEGLLLKAQATAWEDVADAVIDWENIPDDAGGALDFNAENVKAVLSRFPAIVQQIKDDAGDIDDFLALANVN